MRRHWDCWETETTPTTSQPPSSSPSTSGGPEPEKECYPPRIDNIMIGPTCEITIKITRG